MTVILVALTILFFLALDWLVHGRREREGVIRAQVGAGEVPQHVRLPDGVFFAPSHTWLNLFPTGRVTLGVDDFVARLLDNPQVSLLKQAGDAVVKGDPILRLESAGHSLTVRSPIDAEVLVPNANLVRTPTLMRDALFSDGWAYTLRPRSVRDVKGLLLGDESRAWLRGEFGRLRDLFASAAPAPALCPVLLQDGGPPVAGVMKEMDEATWRRFEVEFLGVK